MKTRQSLRLLATALLALGAASGALAQEYITEVMTIGAEKGKGGNVRKEYSDKGWTVVNSDLNAGAGGWDIYIAYKTSSTANPKTGYITDICVTDHEAGDSYVYNGRTYHRVANNSGFNGDLNKGCGSGTAYIVAYYTRDRNSLGTCGGTKRVMTRLSISNKADDGDTWTEGIYWRFTNNTSDGYTGVADMNRDAGGNDIFIQQHFTTQTMKWKEEPTFSDGLIYNGEEQALVTNNPWETNQPATLKYKVNDGDWSSSVPKGLAVGNYIVSAYLDPVFTYWGIRPYPLYIGWITSQFANNSSVITNTITINPPIVKADNLTGVFNQADKKVLLSWDIPSIPGNYADFKWVVYRDGMKIDELAHDVTSYSDTGYTNETAPVYDVYYVSNFWDVTTQRDDTKASVTVSTTRTVPIRNLKVDQQPDRIVFTWTSDAYRKGFGNEFKIYVDDETLPIFTLTPADMQDSFQWEHRTTDQHTNRQDKKDPETGVTYTEEPLNACAPHTYRIEGIIGDKVLNTSTAKQKAIGEGTKFYSLDTTKGVYEGSVKLSWHVDQQGSPLAKTYIVERRRAEQESEAWEVLTRMSSTEDYLIYTDDKALPGVYYEYRVTVEDKCDDGSIIQSNLVDIGFAKSTGTVTGNISYGSTGTAVQGVDVEMVMTSSGGEYLEQFHSVYFTDMNGAVTWQYPSDDYAAGKFATGDFSIQLWLYPEAFSEGTIVDFGNGAGLGMTASGGLTFAGGNLQSQTFEGITLKQNAYNHVALTRSGQTLTCYVLTIANSTETNVQKSTLTLSDATLQLADARQFTLGHFKGTADEFRLWTKCLSEDTIMENYDHLLVGDENQLETYWTFDEGLGAQFFDYTRDGTNYRKHHGHMGSNAQPSTLTPGALRLKAKTDADGNYSIQGIPFTGEGTTYSIIPLYGIHEFKPSKVLRFVGKSSLAHAVDFEDVSSFTMSGYIYYAGTNIPVEGVMMYVDGIAQSKEGKAVQTNSDGLYTLSVPIGNHYVEARLGSHTFVDGGRWPTQGTFYFDRAVQHDFSDSTLVNFVGRVGGGERNDTLAVGFGESKNNIGIAEIQLGLLNESFSFNMQDDHFSDATSQRTWQSDTTSIRSTTTTEVGDDARYIKIRTDSLTGEFSALLPPLKYITRSIQVRKNPDIEFTSLPEIDLTQVGQELTDSLMQVVDGDSVWCYYKYNTKMIQTYFAPPQLDVLQSGNETGAYGIKTLKDYVIDYGTSQDTITIDNIWSKEADGSITYLLGYPLYEMGDWYSFNLFAYETYNNYDSDEAVSNIIPLPGQVITIVNEMSSEQPVVFKVDDPASDYKVGDIYSPKPDTYQLGADGRGTYEWQAGLPNITAPYTRNFNVTMERNGRTYVMTDMPAVVLGHLSTGNNFVTKGPDVVDFVLRDPPGAKSKTTLKSASYTQYSKISFDKAYGDEKFVLDLIKGSSLDIGNGVGFIVLSSASSQIDVGGGIHATWEKGTKDETKTNFTVTESISTGTAYPYVGSDGDVYVGTSYNLLLGEVRNLEVTREDRNSPYTLQVKDAFSMGTEIATSFKYSQYEITTVMIPKWKEQRNSFLTEVADSITAYQYVNTGDKSVYLTWLKPGDEWYGKFGYRYVPADFVDEEDSVNWCNIQIDNWIGAIKHNEEEKVKVIEEGKFENFSIDGGDTYTYSTHNERSYGSGDVWSWKIGGIFNLTTGHMIKNAAKIGLNVTLTTENGRTKGEDEMTTHGNYQDWEYTIYDGNRDVDLSINKYAVTGDSNGWHSNSDIFTIFGGQTYNPFEPADSTIYYKPGTPLGNGTVQMEQPNLGIAMGDQNPAKNVTLTDIPSGQEANVTLYCTNMANVHQGVNFSYNLLIVEKTNDQGLEILMDGVPINGRSVLLNQSETTKKVLTIRQTDQSILDYEGIKIRFCSQYQPLKIYDEVTLNAHFIPSSSPVDLVISEPVLNIMTLDHNEGNLEMKVTNFNRQFKGMTKIGVEYRFEGSTTWSRPDTLAFFVNRADSTKLHDQVLPATGDLRLRFNMSDDNTYPQGSYTFRAYTSTMYGTETVNAYSSEITVVKDNMRPRNLTTPEPTNGILRYGDDIAIEFNEDIVPGYVSDKNIIITAKLNSQPIDHDVAKLLTPYLEEQKTINPIFLNGDFSFDFWFIWGASGTILSHGGKRFSLGVNDRGNVVVKTGNTEFVSQNTIPLGEWTYMTFSFSASKQTFSVLAQYETTTAYLFTDENVPLEALMGVDYSSDNYLYLGDITGAIHDLSLYNIYRDPIEAAATKNQAKDNYVNGLVNHWPMNEGHGTAATDTRHTHDFIVKDMWLMNHENHAVTLDDNQGIQANISRINTSRGDSYAIELWAKKANTLDKEQTVFETGTGTGDKLRLYYDLEGNVVLNYGGKKQTVVPESLVDYRVWHHLALNVVRGQAASFYFDGQRTAVISENDVPPISGAFIKVGENMGYAGRIDELRIWHATLSEERLLSNMYNSIDTTDVYSHGLVAYYPFEKDGVIDGIEHKIGTLENMAPGASGDDDMYSVNSEASYLVIDMVDVPPLKSAPKESRILAKPVASERKIVIMPLEGSTVSARDLEGTMLNITVDKINDMHGNQSLPIRWQVYCQRNTLKWTKDSVNVIKQYGDDYTFDVDIENRSGRTEYYTLYNMPQWLTLVDSERTDDVQPLRTKTLRFQINPLVAVGNYDITIGLQGNYEIQEPLRIVMKVSGQTPEWAVDPTKYDHQMTIIGQININGVLMENAESMVAAFIDGECRGVASPTKVRGAAYVTLGVYGTDIEPMDRNKPVTFRIWDASKGVAYTDVQIAVDGNATDVLFQQDKMIGNYDSPAIWTKSDKVEQLIPIHENWNWIAFGVEPQTSYLDLIFSEYQGWEMILKNRDTFSDSNGVEWNGNLAPRANDMYKLKVSRTPATLHQELATQLSVSGRQPSASEMPVTLRKNWNWIAYTPLTTMTIGEALAGANPQVGDIVKSQTAVSIYGPTGWEGTLQSLESGHGYVYFSTDSTEKQFVYPAASMSSSRMSAPRRKAEPLSIFTPVSKYLYPNNMTMVVRLTDGENVADTCELAAFVGDECRGATRAMNGLYYLVITGEGAGQPMTLRTCLDGEIVTIDESLQFVSDANIGTFWQPYVIDLQDIITGITTPDGTAKDDDWYSLQGFKLGRRPSLPGVYIHRGKAVIVKE